MTPDDRWLEWMRLREVLRGRPLPCAFIDMDALEANLSLLLARTPAPLRLRIATQSIRVPALLRHVAALAGDRLAGWRAFHAEEARMLVEHGLDGILLASPLASRAEADTVVALVAAGRDIMPMVDCPAHVRLLEAAASAAGVQLRVCVDADVSHRPLSIARPGARRSSIGSVDDALRLVRALEGAPHLSLVGLMACEAQVAGRPKRRSRRVETRAAKWLEQRSVRLADQRRNDIVQALRAAGHPITLVSAGGGGSLQATQARAVTEVAAGPGLYAPHLVEGDDDLPLQPAAFFAVQVIRQPAPHIITCAGGGYVASGPCGPDRLPTVHAPGDLAPLSADGFGELQTPLRWSGRGAAPPLGAPIICRPAKAGELMEHFERVLWVRGNHIIDETPTYRGLGGRYL